LPIARRAFAASLLSAALAVSCLGSKQTVDETETVGAITRGLCAYSIKCGLGNFERVEDCVLEPNRSCVLEDLDAPLVGAAACARTLRALSCSELIGSPPAACEEPLATMSKRGGHPDLNEGCSDATSCMPGLYCTGEGEAPACGVCLRLPRVGEACPVRTECAASAFCSEARRCEAQRANGASCALHHECLVGNCVDAKCAPELTVREGESCLAADCEPGTVCVSSGQCRALASAGERCEQHQCFRGFACVEGRCAAVPGCGMGREGEPCNSDSHCVSGFDCDASDRCVPARIRKLEFGAACARNDDCVADYCVAGKCTDPGLVCTARAQP
jgi:hypothetical protein